MHNLRPFQNEDCTTIKEVLLFLCLEYTFLLDVSLEVGQTEHKNLLPLRIYFGTDYFMFPLFVFLYLYKCALL